MTDRAQQNREKLIELEMLEMFEMICGLPGRHKVKVTDKETGEVVIKGSIKGKEDG